METSSGSSPDSYLNQDSATSSSSTGSNAASNSSRYTLQFPAISFLRSPVSTLLEYSGILRTRSGDHESEPLVHDDDGVRFYRSLDDSGSASSSGSNGEVSIRIIGVGEQEHGAFDENDESIGQIATGGGGSASSERGVVDGGDVSEVGGGERPSSLAVDSGNGDVVVVIVGIRRIRGMIYSRSRGEGRERLFNNQQKSKQ